MNKIWKMQSSRKPNHWAKMICLVWLALVCGVMFVGKHGVVTQAAETHSHMHAHGFAATVQTPKLKPPQVQQSSPEFYAQGKRLVEKHIQETKTTLRDLEGKIAFERGQARLYPRTYPGVMLGFYESMHAYYSQSLARAENVLRNWDTWGKLRIADYLPSPDSDDDIRGLRNPNEVRSEPCRECYTCRGTGQIGPFGNAYSGAGYKPAVACSNCNGSGRVCR